MSESKDTRTDRRTLAALAGGGILGAFSSIFVGTAQAQDGGAAAAQVALLIERFNAYRKDFAETTSFITSIRDTVKGGIDKYFEWTQDLWDLNNAINGLMTAVPGLGTQIKDLPAEVLGHLKSRIGEVEALGKAYEATAKGNVNTRYGLAFRARARTGRALGETAAMVVREKYMTIANSIAKRDARQKNKGEQFSSATAPLAMEQSQLILESLLRMEQRLDRILELSSGQEFYEPVKPLSKKDVEKAFADMKKGKGTLIDDGDKL